MRGIQVGAPAHPRRGMQKPNANLYTRDVLEGGGGSEGEEGEGGGGWDAPPSQGPTMVLTLNPLGTEGAETKFWLSASNIGRGGGGGGVPGGLPPSSYGVRPF